jgi:Dna[CI] antecedent, DciA
MTGRHPDPEAAGRARRPQRVGDLLPDAARHLGLEDELRLARAISTWDALVAELVPPAAGACRLVALEPDTVVVAVDEPIVASELRMRAGAPVAPPVGRRDVGRPLGVRTGPTRIIRVPAIRRASSRHPSEPTRVARPMRLAPWLSVSS